LFRAQSQKKISSVILYIIIAFGCDPNREAGPTPQCTAWPIAMLRTRWYTSTWRPVYRVDNPSQIFLFIY